MTTTTRRGALGIIAGAGASALIGATGFSTIARAQGAPTKMRLRLDFLVNTPHVYFYAAREKGYFTEEGLDIEILEGNTSAQAIQQVANKDDDFGVAGFDALVNVTQEGVPAQMVMCNFRSTPTAIMCLESSGIKDFKDITDKKLGVRAGSGPTTLLPALFAKAGIASDKVSQLNLDFSAFIPSLLAGRIDAFAGLATSQYPILAGLAKEPVKVLYFAEAGVVAMSMGIVAHPDTIRDKPQQVKGFVRAVQRGMKWSHENSEEAGKLLNSLFPRKVKLEEAKLALDIMPNFVTSTRTKGAPLGQIDEADASDTIDLLKSYAGLRIARDPKSYYTNAFIDTSIL